MTFEQQGAGPELSNIRVTDPVESSPLGTFSSLSHSDVSLHVLGILNAAIPRTLYVSLDDIFAMDFHGVHLGVQAEDDFLGAVVCDNSSFNSW